MPLIEAYADVPREAGGQTFVLGMHLHTFQIVVYVSSEDLGESAHMRTYPAKLEFSICSRPVFASIFV